MNKKLTKALTTCATVLGLLTLGGCNSLSQASSTHHYRTHYVRHGYRHHYNRSDDDSSKRISEQLADSVMTPNIKQQLGNNIQYNGHGAFIVNDNQSTLNANVHVAPYATNEVDKMGRPTVGNAFLNKTCRQYKNRQETGNGASDWKPKGFHQLSGLTYGYSHAYDRGHLLGYALVGGIKGFNASESNPKNIATQTAWANEAGDKDNTGQNYYEGIVRKALDKGKKVRYQVQDVYNGNNIVPSGAHIQAKSTDGTVDFNVFVPNVQSNIKIDYATGYAQVTQGNQLQSGVSKYVQINNCEGVTEQGNHIEN